MHLKCLANNKHTHLKECSRSLRVEEIPFLHARPSLTWREDRLKFPAELETRIRSNSNVRGRYDRGNSATRRSNAKQS